jgi:hypothetical protein
LGFCPLEKDLVWGDAGVVRESNCIGRWWWTAAARPRDVVRPRLRGRAACRRRRRRLGRRKGVVVVVVVVVVVRVRVRVAILSFLFLVSCSVMWFGLVLCEVGIYLAIRLSWTFEGNRNSEAVHAVWEVWRDGGMAGVNSVT